LDGFLEASQNGKIALIHQLAAETLHVGCASLLVLVQISDKSGERRNAVRSITIAWSLPSADGALRSRRIRGIAASERIIISLKSSI
jgi:hypothetical protein